MWLVKKQFNPLSNALSTDIFEEVFSDLSKPNQCLSEDRLAPLELVEDKGHVKVAVELPGYDKKDIQVDYKEGYLSVKAEKKVSKSEKDENTHYSEFSKGTRKRSIYVGDINFDKAKAELLNGVLTVDLPKVEELKAKTLVIE